MGHVVNYAYRLYEDEEWILRFGSITQPYEEDYRPQPFSRRYVRHLPGWYAQKHPDEDWSETFAVWLTPGLDWRGEYEGWPEALAKLSYCERTVARILDREPLVTDAEPDEEVGEIPYSVGEYYEDEPTPPPETTFPPGLDGALRAIFERLGDGTAAGGASLRRADGLIRSLERDLMENVFRWAGHFPERTRMLVRHLAERAGSLELGYEPSQESAARLAVTTLVTALAMNYVHRGSYLP